MNFKFAAVADESSNVFTEQVEALVRNGYDFLEIRNLNGKSVTGLTLEEAKECKKLLADNGLCVRSVGSPIGKIDVNGDFDAHMDLFKHTLEVANVLGAERMRLFSFFMPEGENPENYRNVVLERMAIIAETAKEYGVIPCHENEKGIYGETAQRCAEIHKAVPEIKGIFDPANFVYCGHDTLEAWEILKGYVDYMHVKDALADGRVVLPGDGIGHVPEILAMYGAQGGEMITLEPHLHNFIGLDNLEREGQKTTVVGNPNFATMEEAFDYAARHLKNLANSL